MKLFCDLLARRRSNKKKEKSIISSFSPRQSFNQSASSYSDQTSNLFDKRSRCTCHYFNFTENNRINPIQTTINSSSSIDLESCSEMKYILTVDDFCFWYDVRSTLLDMIDRVVAMDEAHERIIQQIPSAKTEFRSLQSNQVHRKRRRPKTSIAIQTSHDHEQRRNAKVQTNTVTLFPIQNSNLSSSKLFLN